MASHDKTRNKSPAGRFELLTDYESVDSQLINNDHLKVGILQTIFVSKIASKFVPLPDQLTEGVNKGCQFTLLCNNPPQISELLSRLSSYKYISLEVFSFYPIFQ